MSVCGLSSCGYCNQRYNKSTKILFCRDCTEIRNIPTFLCLEQLYCERCVFITLLPSTKSLIQLSCCECPLLYRVSYVIAEENLRLKKFHCFGCPLFHVPLKLFLKCNGQDGFGYNCHKPRLRNGISYFSIAGFLRARLCFIRSLGLKVV